MRPSRPVLAATSLVLFGGLTWLVSDWAPVGRFDAAASGLARRFGTAHPAWVAAMRVVTHAGDGAVMAALAVAVGCVLLVLRRFQQLATLVLGVLAARGALTIMQPAVGRHRPVDGFVHVALPSYPSGHTVQSASMALLLLVLVWRWLPRRAKVPVAVAAAAWAGLVGLSRVALLAHWPTDVLGGWLLVLGVVSAAVEAVEVARQVVAGRGVRAAGSEGPGQRPAP